VKSLLVFIAGFATPVALFLAANVYMAFEDWRDNRRYKRAWDKFSAEFEKLTPEHLSACRSRWAEDPCRYDRYFSDRDRYFSMRWQYGHTKEV
jgi:hypothetical protein